MVRVESPRRVDSRSTLRNTGRFRFQDQLMTTYYEMMPDRVLQEELEQEKLDKERAIGEVLLDYTNYRGERRRRYVLPVALLWYPDGTEWHKGPQWVLQAKDLEDGGKIKGFAMSNIHSWQPVE